MSAVGGCPVIRSWPIPVGERPVPAPDPVGARPATWDDVRAIGVTHTRAMRDDPVWRWLVPDDRRWRPGIPHVFRVSALDHLATTRVTTGVTSVAVWTPPGHRVDRWREARHGPGQLVVFRSRALSGMWLLEAMRKVHPREPHLVSPPPRRRPRTTGPGARLRRPAAGARPVRRRRVARLSGVVEGVEAC